MSLSPVKPIVIKGIKLAYLNTKTDSYKNDITYFKISSKDIDGKLSKLNVDGYKLPWFKTEDGKYTIKTKSKHVNIKDLERMKVYFVNISFMYYSISGNEGYYIKAIDL